MPFEAKVNPESLINSLRDLYGTKITAAHIKAYCAQNDNIYKNILPPLSLLNRNDEKELMNRLKDLEFYNKSTLAA